MIVWRLLAAVFSKHKLTSVGASKADCTYSELYNYRFVRQRTEIEIADEEDDMPLIGGGTIRSPSSLTPSLQHQ